MTGPAFREGSYYLPYFIVLGGLQAIFSTINLQLNAMKIAKPRISLNITCALIGSVLTFFGAKLFGISGVLASIAITYAMKITWEVYLVRKYPMVRLTDPS